MSVGALRSGSSGRARHAGAGVLVAPDLVLTNHHVVARVGPLTFTLPSGTVSVRAIERWRAGDPGDEAGVITHPERLDYALLRLSASVSDPPCSPERGAPVAGAALTVIGWRPGAKAVTSWPAIAIGPDPTGTRWWYRGDLPRGASGALVVDGAGRPVALHHARLPDGRWQGVSLAAIDAAGALKDP